jgi:REP element-mobilizing transposase RayT
MFIPIWPERKRLRLDGADYSDPSYVYFATLCARAGGAPFAVAALAHDIVEAIHWSRTHGRWRVFAFCLMPDHLHLALSPVAGGWPLSRVFQAFKSWTTHESWGHGIHGALWQRGWYDHIVRREESLEHIMQYILANPVRRGLVESPEEWPYSGTPDPLEL